MSQSSIRVLFATPECAPLVKTGGLGDVSGSLPAALARLGVDVRVLLPAYIPVLDALPKARRIGNIPARGSFPPATLLYARDPHGLPLFLLDCPPHYRRHGGPYQDSHGNDWPDNAMRFGMLSYAAALLGSEATPLSRRAQVVHCNDWQTGLAPAYSRFDAGAHAPTVVTIHNLAFQGNFDAEYLSELDLPQASFSIDGLEFYGRLSFLKAAISYADAIITVSPTYAQEIQSEPLGFGLQGLLAARKDDLTGILNGIDTDLWNPATDPLIARRYGAGSLDAKAENKRALQQAMGLDVDAAIPLLGSVSRLAHQKGTDLLLDIAPAIAALPAQLAIQGVGDADLRRRLAAVAQRHPGKIAVKTGFDEPLAHQIEAGADMFLVPSRFEPCGMTQMFSQRYGTPPVAHATGGLIDSIVDCNPRTLAEGTASGFLFAEASDADFLAAIERAIAVYRDAPTWRALQRNGMARDFGWETNAAKYLEIYRRVVTPRP